MITDSCVIARQTQLSLQICVNSSMDVDLWYRSIRLWPPVCPLITHHSRFDVTDHGTNYTQHADRHSKHVHGASMSTNVHHAWALAVQANALRIMLRDRSVRVLYICMRIT